MMLMLATGGEILLALAIAGATGIATQAISAATKPKVGVPSPGPDPFPDGIPGADEAAIRARLAQRRDLSSLRIDAAAGPGVATGLQIPN